MSDIVPVMGACCCETPLSYLIGECAQHLT